MESTSFYGTVFQDYTPSPVLQPYVAAYWFLNNRTGAALNVPVVPDGCSDILFYLSSNDPPFVVGVMSHARIVPTPDGMKLFGIRFRPAIVSFLLGADMRRITDTTMFLADIGHDFMAKMQLKGLADEEIIAHTNSVLESLIVETDFNDYFLHIVGQLSGSPDIPIKELARKNNLGSKNLERLFYRHVGVSPKKFSGIMRFFRAHKSILHNGLQDLVTTSLESGYFDQAHFNREYKKLTGTNPTSEVMSILYKNRTT